MSAILHIFRTNLQHIYSKYITDKVQTLSQAYFTNLYQIWGNIEERLTMSETMAKKDDRLVIAPLGEPYEDLLNIDSFLAGNSVPQQGKSLLSAYLKQKKAHIEEAVSYLARKRKISFEEMWDAILTGQVEKLSPEDYRNILSKDQTKG